ncbi:MAG TPA: class I SAM-dependent methyltransferase [Rhizomicrobium sp.]|jgi:methyltransferase (TIGR00027 family)|nr:class I SAM-dependent methyltransferase [Rhizomicrobium sp.]
MEAHQPSRTAQGAALHRAAHQLVDSPPVFADPLALRIVGDDAADQLRKGQDHHAMAETAPLRLFIATRSRFTEDSLAEAYAAGVRQYAILGAGLDTFAYERARAYADLAIFEIDHPATQIWKRARLEEAAIAVPETVTYTPVDFERDTLNAGLARAGFDFDNPAFFAWLGVTPYLTREAIDATLSFIASLKTGSGVAFDYAEPPGADHARFDAMAARVAAIGEPFKSLLDPAELAQSLTTMGFSRIKDFGGAMLNARYFQNRADGRKLAGRGHMMRAIV